MEPERYFERSGVVRHRGPVEAYSRVAGIAVRTNEFGQPVGIELSGWKSPPAPRRSLLQGQFCQVEPLCEQTHGRSLFAAFAADARGANWTYMPYGPFTAYADFSRWLAWACAATDPTAAFDTRTPGRWIVSHLRCYPVVVVLAVLCQLVSWLLFALMPVMIGRAAQVVIDGLGSRELLLAALRLLGVMAGNAAALITVMACTASLGHRLQRDARDELYRGLLGKSQTFHNRQRIGDLVARATDDTRMVNEMINPGLVYLTDLPIGFVVTLTYVLLIDPVLAIVPALYGLAFVAAVRDHMRRVGPALAEQRTQYGRLAAVAEEVVNCESGA